MKKIFAGIGFLAVIAVVVILVKNYLNQKVNEDGTVVDD